MPHRSQGKQIRDFLFVEDVADALVALLNSDVTGPVNIGSGSPISVANVTCEIFDRLSSRDLIQLGAKKTPAHEPPVLLPDVRRLFDEVGWRPRYDLPSGLDQTIEWWKARIRSIAEKEVL